MFPTDLVDLPNPDPRAPTNSPVTPLAGGIANLNAVVEALQAKVGVDGSAVAGSLDARLADVEARSDDLQNQVDAAVTQASADFDALRVLRSPTPPVGKTFYSRRQVVLERQTRATYHATFLASGDFYAVSPIIAVTREPTDATYTTDDVYDAIAVAPTASVLTDGLPNASGGNASWKVSANQVFPRSVGAATSSPVLRVGTPISCRSIPRTDGGPGRLAMTRVWSLGSIHANAATTRMPVVDDSPVNNLANCQLWDTEFPLAAVGQFYYKNSTDHASTDQGSFGAAATRWASSCMLGLKFHYAKPSVTVLASGDSIIGGDYSESGKPTRCSFGWRAAYALMLEGRQVDFINAGFSGYRWDQFGPVMQKLVAQLTPDILLLPIHSGNGVTAGVGIGYTQADADLQVSIAMQYAEWALNNGVKHVVFVTPMPSTTPNYNGMYANLTSLVAASGFPYLDTMSVVANQDLTWKANYSIDGGHPTALANAALAVELADVLRPYTMLA